jgi:hypothetical protein
MINWDGDLWKLEEETTGLHFLFKYKIVNGYTPEYLIDMLES